MNEVRVGVIGIGNMGRIHATYLQQGKVRNARLTAVCDTNPAALKWAEEHLGNDIQMFSNSEDFFGIASVDAVMVVTPHYSHPGLAISGFEKGLHVLIEKPAGVGTKQVRKMNEAAQRSGKAFSIMFCNRTYPVYQRVRDLILTNELGDLKRINWTVTHWYRSQSYYDSGGWRATWKGEGGGVLLNQAPHELDLWQWMFGLPERVRAFCHYGKYHEIEVEDDVTAYLEYPNGTTGTLITSTGEAPGTNRLEIAGDRGRLIVEDDQIWFDRLSTPEREFNRTYRGGFGSPEAWKCQIPVQPNPQNKHAAITQNWVDAITKGTPLLTEGREGIRSLELSNAMHLSSWLDDWVSIPVDEDAFERELGRRVAMSQGKQVEDGGYFDASGSFR
ncbi:MAG TPA: oxidoreductase [Firmicutes bacterium]|nr:oxidoreductase [Bacillota bacterium]